MDSLRKNRQHYLVIEAAKQSEMSPSMNQCVPFQTFTTSLSAVWQPRWGRKVWDRSENRTS